MTPCFFAADQICGPGNGGCSHFCNVIGGIGVCTCPQGLALSQDKRTCVGKNIKTVERKHRKIEKNPEERIKIRKLEGRGRL